jgi:hypothetical protein
LPWRWLLNDVIDAPEAGLAPAGPANVAARYDIVTAGKNWVTVVASSGSFDRLGHAFAVSRPSLCRHAGKESAGAISRLEHCASNPKARCPARHVWSVNRYGTRL